MSEFVVSDLVAKLRLDKGTYDADLNTSKASMDQFTEGVRRAGEGIKRNFAGGITAASVATGVVAAGTVGLLVKLTKTGAAYNMLQQNSRAALASIMGGTEKASKQMDKLDAFARTSPFAKDAFIAAQQQLLGFNVEAKKVIPIMDAVQQAVAATGGTSSDVAGLVDVFAKIKGQGKLTGDAIMQLGVRGIDAADILGKAMGKTGEEIRKSISKGAIGADEAIDILTKGLQTKFGGATAGIKQQMSGALDRVKGASRDIGSALAEPFIKKNGGGRAVVWTNEFADALRAAEKKTGPLVNMLVGRMNPAFNQLSYHLQDIKGWIDRLDVGNIEAGLDKMGKHAPAIAGVSAAFAAMGTQLPILSRLGLSVNPLVAGIAAMVAASPELRGVFVDAIAAGKPLLPLIEQLAGHFSKGLNSAISATVPLLESGVSALSNTVSAAAPLVDMAGNLVEWFAQLPGPVQTAVVAFAAFAALRGKFDWVTNMGRDLAGTVSAGFGKFRDEVRMAQQTANSMRFPGAGDALRVLDRQISTTYTQGSGKFKNLGIAATTAGRTITRGLKGAATGLMGLFGGPWGIALGAGVMALGAYSAAQAEARQRVEEFKGTLDESTGAITKNTDAMAASAIAGDEGSKGFYLWSSGAESASDTLKILGKSTQDTAAIVAAGGADYDHMIEQLKKFEEASAAGGVQFDNMGNIISQGDGGAALDAWATSMGLTSEAARQLSTADLVHLIGVLETQRGAVEGATGTWERMNDSIAETPNATSAVADAIKLVGDAAGDATGRLQAYKDIIDIMNGVLPNADEQQRKLAATTRTLGEFFKETDDNGKLLNKGLINAKDGTIALSDAGDRLNGILRPQVDAALAAAIAASDHAIAMGDEAGAAAAADAALAPMRKSIQGLARDGSISQEQADALSQSLLGIPGETSLVITDGGSAEALKLKLTDLVRQIEATPDGQITIKENSPEVIDALSALGYRVETLPDGVIKVTENGAVQTGNTIDGVASRKRTAPISVKEIGAAAAGAAIDRQARDRYTTIWARERVISSGNQASTGRGGSGGLTRATGGPIHGPGSGTSDDVPVMASNGEHMWTAAEVRAAGGHSVMKQMRNAVMSGQLMRVFGYANGGPIGRAGWSASQDADLKKKAARATAARKRAEQQAKASEKSVDRLQRGQSSQSSSRVDRAQKAYSSIPSGKKNAAAKAAAKRELESAKLAAKNSKAATKREIDAAKRRLKTDKAAATRAAKNEDAAKDALRDSKARTSRLSEATFDLKTDIRRGGIRTAFMNGSGMQYVDKMFEQSKNPDLSKRQRSNLRSAGYSTERQILKLEKQADSLAIKYGIATKRRDDLLQVKEGVKSQLSNEFGLSTMLQWGTLKNGPLTAGDIAKGASQKAAQIKKFAQKLNALRKKGYSAMVIQDVASLGTNEGTLVADALLAGDKSEVKQINSAFYGIDQFADQAGVNVTEAMHKGGVNAAQGLVNGIESQQKNVESAFERLAKAAERAFKNALGIHSPSTVFAGFAGDTADGYIIELNRRRKDAEAAMIAFAQVPNLVKQLPQQFGSGGSPQRLVEQTNHIYYPVAEPSSVSKERAMQLVNLPR